MKSDSTTFTDACILTVQVETNVPQGGDAGHGGKTAITLRDAGSFAFGGLGSDQTEVTIEVLGDIEAKVLADALVWAGERLRELTA